VRHGGILRAKRTLEWWIAAVNLLGCILFLMAAIASYVVPDTGDILDLAAANVTTSLGALCFLIGAVLLLSEGGRTHDDSSQPGDSPVEMIAETPG
jgi:multisubunit Na+/H+ antiporter MnhG subunit